MPRLDSSPSESIDGVIATTIYMKNKTTTENERLSEPVGIVISRGSRAEPAPIIHAFVYGTAPELTPVPQDTRAA